MGGETSAGAAASGFFLTLLCLLAQALTAFVPPILECFLALSMACCITEQSCLGNLCKAAGILLQKGLSLTGKLLAALLGFQRISAAQLDRTALRTGQFLTGTIPQSGWILTEGAHLYLLDRKPAMPEGEGLAVSEGPVDFISTTLPAAKARAAYGAYLSGRRLPAGCALAAGEGAIGIISSSAYEPDLGHMDMYRLPFERL